MSIIPSKGIDSMIEPQNQLPTLSSPRGGIFEAMTFYKLIQKLATHLQLVVPSAILSELRPYT